MISSPSRLGVCSWSLQAATPHELCERVRNAGLSHIQLALEPIRSGAWSLNETVEALDQHGIHIISGMMETKGEDYTTLESIHETGGVRPDSTWAENQEITQGCAEIAEQLGLSLVTFHAGFLPPSAEDPEHPKMIERLRWIADTFSNRGVGIGLETGQESAATLIAFLDELDRESVGVNFDPANMILYGMGDPVEAIETLAPRVVQVHIKDALPTTTPGTWGSEVPAGEGAVAWPRFFLGVNKLPKGVDLVIEREAGDERVKDVSTAATLVGAHSA